MQRRNVMLMAVVISAFLLPVAHGETDDLSTTEATFVVG